MSDNANKTTIDDTGHGERMIDNHGLYPWSQKGKRKGKKIVVHPNLKQDKLGGRKNENPHTKNYENSPGHLLSKHKSRGHKIACHEAGMIKAVNEEEQP